jgi:hypothetical protein
MDKLDTNFFPRAPSALLSHKSALPLQYTFYIRFYGKKEERLDG